MFSLFLLKEDPFSSPCSYFVGVNLQRNALISRFLLLSGSSRCRQNITTFCWFSSNSLKDKITPKIVYFCNQQQKVYTKSRSKPIFQLPKLLRSLWKLIPQNSSSAPPFWIANNSRGVNRVHFIWCAPTQDTFLSLSIRPIDCFGVKSIISWWLSLRRFVAYVLPRSISVASRINRHEWAGVSNYNVF